MPLVAHGTYLYSFLRHPFEVTAGVLTLGGHPVTRIRHSKASHASTERGEVEESLAHYATGKETSENPG